ncbi:hypothetical protein RJ639_039303 [Escallonia herrerae]|uniref:Uncharacterized protein n=1 Tax=Escallonia herrerae TaxID=1293975 RepID=A0AA88WL90_9ASTE|nr:hypothetical protein RJ639_039303 [Escallonia herrerae]
MGRLFPANLFGQGSGSCRSSGEKDAVKEAEAATLRAEELSKREADHLARIEALEKRLEGTRKKVAEAQDQSIHDFLDRNAGDEWLKMRTDDGLEIYEMGFLKAKEIFADRFPNIPFDEFVMPAVMSPSGGDCLAFGGQSCSPSGIIRGRKPPPGHCNTENDSDCCVQGKLYTTFTCSPHVSGRTRATLTLNSFESGGDGGAPSECDDRFHSDDTPVVALSTGWFNHRSRCLNFITIFGNGRSVRAKVVDECDSTMGCDSDHDFQPPCPNNIVDASRAVWKALGLPKNDWGELDIFWSDA